jgi:aspartokinase/homoserine dehydrogenase 1
VWSDPSGLELTDWRRDLAAAAPGPAGWLDELLARSVPAGTRLGGHGLDGTAVVDATASDEPPRHYARWLAAGASVVAANKRLFAGPRTAWQAARAAARASGAELRGEATVGAGLPVVAPLAALAASGDRVRRVDAVLSGTLNAVLCAVDAGEPLSAAVRAAHDAGLTEPHPWEDLNGLDVARKLVVLARLVGEPMGLGSLELADVEIEPLLPGDGWEGLDVDAFWNRLPEVDASLAARRDEAAGRGLRLRHVARLAHGRARVGVQAVGEGHPAWDLAGADNVIAVHSLRYDARPLVVRGPGAGPAVTAGGLFADLLSLVRRP